MKRKSGVQQSLPSAGASRIRFEGYVLRTVRPSTPSDYPHYRRERGALSIESPFYFVYFGMNKRRSASSAQGKVQPLSSAYK